MSPRLLFLLVASALSISCSTNNKSINLQGSCSACQFVYSTTNSGQILRFPVSNSTGTLGAPTSIAGPANSVGILFNETTLYVSDPANNAVRAYAVSTADGSLSPTSFGPYPVSTIPGAMVTFGGALYVASSAGNIFAFGLGQDGSLTAIAGSPFSAGAGLSHLTVNSLANGNFLYASNSTDSNGSISAFSISSTGALVPVPGSPFATMANSGPEGSYPFGNFFYVALKNANSVAGFAVNPDGSLAPLAGSPFAAGDGTSSLAGADGFLFAANALDGTMSSYSINQLSGLLTQVAGSPFTATQPSGDVLYENGKLFLPDASSNTISGFLPDFASGGVGTLTGSPFQAGAGPLALTAGSFPALDPP